MQGETKLTTVPQALCCSACFLGVLLSLATLAWRSACADTATSSLGWQVRRRRRRETLTSTVLDLFLGKKLVPWCKELAVAVAATSASQCRPRPERQVDMITLYEQNSWTNAASGKTSVPRGKFARFSSHSLCKTSGSKSIRYCTESPLHITHHSSI